MPVMQSCGRCLERSIDLGNSRSAEVSQSAGSVRWLSLWPEFRKIAWTIAGLVALLGGRVVVWAQGCPLCYNAAAATKAGGLAALRNGILILMIPPVLIVGLVCIMGIRRYRSDSAAELDVDREDAGRHHRPESDGYSEGVPLLSGLPGATR